MASFIRLLTDSDKQAGKSVNIRHVTLVSALHGFSHLLVRSDADSLKDTTRHPLPSLQPSPRAFRSVPLARNCAVRVHEHRRRMDGEKRGLTRDERGFVRENRS